MQRKITTRIWQDIKASQNGEPSWILLIREPGEPDRRQPFFDKVQAYLCAAQLTGNFVLDTLAAGIPENS